MRVLCLSVLRIAGLECNTLLPSHSGELVRMPMCCIFSLIPIAGLD